MNHLTADASAESSEAKLLDIVTTPEPNCPEEEEVAAGVVGEVDTARLDPMAAGVFEAPGRHERYALVRTLGERMRQARELCNLSQSAAARRLGYANPSKLSKIEAAVDVASVPLWLIQRAAEVYEVSVDFLFGFTDDWETGARMTQEREVSAWLVRAWNDARVRDVQARLQLENQLAVIHETIAGSSHAVAELEAALKRFIELNPEFEGDMRGGNRLATAVEGVAAAAAIGRSKMIRVGLSKEQIALRKNPPRSPA